MYWVLLIFLESYRDQTDQNFLCEFQSVTVDCERWGMSDVKVIS